MMINVMRDYCLVSIPHMPIVHRFPILTGLRTPTFLAPSRRTTTRRASPRSPATNLYVVTPPHCVYPTNRTIAAHHERPNLHPNTRRHPNNLRGTRTPILGQERSLQPRSPLAHGVLTGQSALPTDLQAQRLPRGSALQLLHGQSAGDPHRTTAHIRVAQGARRQYPHQPRRALGPQVDHPA